MDIGPRGSVLTGGTMGFHPSQLAEVMAPKGDSFAGGLRSPFELYFGAPLGGRELLDRDSRWQGHHTLPRVYQGKSEYQGEFITGLVQYDNTWYTSAICAPIERTDQLAWTWHVFNFEDVYLDRVPEEGVMQTFKTASTQENARSVRRGIALDFEHGFHFSAMGQQHFVRLIQVVQNAVQNTMNMHVMMAILSAKDNDVRMAAQMGWLNKPLRTLILDRAKDAFALQKANHAAKRLISRRREMLSARQVEPNLLIMPKGFEHYFIGAGDENLKYDEAGPSSQTRLNNPTPFNLSSFMGLRIAYSGRFLNWDTRGAAQPAAPLIRRIVFGGYHIMRDPTLAVTGTPTKSMNERTIFKHNMVTDRIEPISLLEAFDALAPYTFTGENGTLPKNFFGKYTHTEGKHTEPMKWGDLPPEFIAPPKTKAVEVGELSEPMEKRLKAADEAAKRGPAVGPAAGASITGGVLARADLEPLVFARQQSTAVELTPEQIQERGAQAGAQLSTVLEDSTARMLPERLSEALSNVYSTAEAGRVLGHVEEALATGNPAVVEERVATPLQKLADAKAKSSKSYKSARAALLPDATGPVGGMQLVSEKELAGLVTVDPLTGQESASPHFYDHNDSVHRALAEEVGVDMSAYKIRDSKDPPTHSGETNSTTGEINLGGDITYEALREILTDPENKQPFPFNILVVCPWKQFQTATGVMLRGGAETMKTHVGHPVAMVGDEATNQTHRMTFTMYSITNVYNRNNITILDNIACRAYIAGSSNKFYTAQELENLADHNFDVSRPQFAHENQPSLIALLIPGSLDRLDTVIDIRGYSNAEERRGASRHYPSADFYTAAFGWDAIPDPDPERPNESPLNTSCIQDHTEEWNVGTNKHDQVIPNHGHFGVNVYEGMRDVLEGREDILEPQHYERLRVARLVR